MAATPGFIGTSRSGERIECETIVVTRSFSRAERVGGQVQKVLAGLIQNGISDPRLAQATITGVSMSRDLRIAKVYFATHGGADGEHAALTGFESAKGFIKRELARELGLRYMPDLKFFYDASFDYGAHINRVLKSIQTDDEKNNPTVGEQ
ncbi:ribosome-binding factor A [Desulfosarcina alkanivorans]|uniref:Ribosome-binding factor A n=1 Tax=Desulfosarcina alkanivorans TaxID=571177 RepID=A0A5K7YKU9_9BACT|nr:30S ribosome-binding factor RbfA [Desulfosarcina alkanivorans]BBO69153.1 ribosome-binding factor A [Desulfosarcina alkanivorans]